MKNRDEVFEIQLEGLVGPTHHYAGQSLGNQASMQSEGALSSPREAAMQSLEKMNHEFNWGLRTLVLPPVPRIPWAALRDLGFLVDSDRERSESLRSCFVNEPKLFSAIHSASSMWAANSATFSPALDSGDQLGHFTVANLSSNYHRSLEAPYTLSLLRAIFNSSLFKVHEPVVSSLGDEGAANHGRLFNPDHPTQPGLEIFVYGKKLGQKENLPLKYPARQILEASRVIARNHKLSESNTLFIQQNPQAIDLGIFHNDVASVFHEDIVFTHENAWISGEADRIQEKWKQLFPRKNLHWTQLNEREISLSECVKTYLFNSQLLTFPDGFITLVAPKECEEHEPTNVWIQRLIATHPKIKRVQYLNLKQSMRNGGGPACLRLRVFVNSAQWASIPDEFKVNEKRLDALRTCVSSLYPNQLSVEKLANLDTQKDIEQIFKSVFKQFKLNM